MIYHILYISEKSEHFKGPLDIEDILVKSREKNKNKGITGILIKNGNYFVQLLEGKKEIVLSVFNKISDDPRHYKVRTLFTYQDNSRIFPKWDMGLVNDKEHAVEINELIPFLHEDILKLGSKKDKIVSILKRFNKLD